MLLMIAVHVVVFLCSVNLVNGQSCHDGAPDNCTFTSGVCNWVRKNGGESVLFTDSYLGDRRLVFGGSGLQSGILTSRPACPTERIVHCLKFQYRFEENQNLSLSVFIERNDVETLLWKATDSTRRDTWGQAAVPVHSDSVFKIIIKIQRYDSTLNKVYIDTLQYEKSTCALFPPNAAPPSPSGSTSSSSTSLSTAVPTTQPSVSRTSSSESGPSKPGTSEPSTVPQVSDSGGSASSVAMIVGVVIAVAIVVGIAVLLFILHRRHKLQAIKFWFLSKTQKTPTPSQTTAHSFDNRGLYISNGTQRNTADPVYENHSLTPLPGTHSSHDYDYNALENNGYEVPVPVIHGTGPEYANTMQQGIIPGNTRSTHMDAAAHRELLDSQYSTIDESENATQHEQSDTMNSNPYGNNNKDGASSKNAASPSVYNTPSSLQSKSKSPSSDESRQTGPSQDYYNTSSVQAGSYYNPPNTGFGRSENNTGTAATPISSGDSRPAGPSQSYYSTAIPQAERNTRASGAATISLSSHHDGLGSDYTLAKPIADGLTDVYHSVDGDPSCGKGSRAEDEEYHSLNLRTKKGVPEERDHHELRAVYSHLSEGGEDTYSEVDRERRVEVIDAEYSHL